MTQEKKPKNLSLIRWSRWIVAAIFVSSAAFAAAPQPNIVLIISDDQGYADFSSRGTGQVDTPNLDGLENQSRVFNAFYVEPACAPTRASLHTGRSYVRTGVWHVHFGGDYIGLGETLLPEVLKSAGYTTGLVGKWHSGKTPGYLPTDRGFDQAVLATMHDHRRNPMAMNEAPLRLSNAEFYRQQPDPGWTVDRMNEEAARFMAEQGNKPFFLEMAYVAPHSAWDAPEDLLKKYKARGQSDRFAALNALIEHLDSSVGRLLADIDRLGLTDNTIVLFVSDNGYTHNNVGRFTGNLDEKEIAQRNPRGLRGTKGTLFEGGLLAPLYVRWPARIQPGATEALGHVTDLLPTLAEIAGVPSSKLPPRLDGRSLAPMLFNHAAPSIDRIVFGSAMQLPARDRVHNPPLGPGRDLAAERARLDYREASLYARDTRFKLMKSQASLQLFDLRDDPQEKWDVSAQFPEDTQRLEIALHAWFDSVIAEPVAFSSPVFLIGRPPAGVLAFNGAWTFTGDFQGNPLWAQSSSATKAGSSVEWHVRVEKPGIYTVWLQADVTEPGRRVAFQTGDHRIESSLSPGPLHDLGRIEIEADLERITFTLIDPGLEPNPGIANIWNVVLEPVSAPPQATP